MDAESLRNDDGEKPPASAASKQSWVLVKRIGGNNFNNSDPLIFVPIFVCFFRPEVAKILLASLFRLDVFPGLVVSDGIPMLVLWFFPPIRFKDLRFKDAADGVDNGLFLPLLLAVAIDRGEGSLVVLLLLFTFELLKTR